MDNNQLDTIVTVIKGGVNVLLIDKERAWEPQLIYDALARDPRIQVKPLWLRGSAPIEADAGKLFDFDKQKYDVIIIGDVTAAQMQAIQPDVLEQIAEQVDRGAGFLMIGGYASFGGDPDVKGTGDWKGTVVQRMLPVDLSVRGQVESRTPLYGLIMVPTEDGLRLYSRVVGLSGGDAEAEKAAWKRCKAPGLEGVNRLALAAGSNAVGAGRVGGDGPENQCGPTRCWWSADYGGGRVLAFAGDTTNRWIHDRDGKRKHDRFWRQMVLWLARQDEGDDQLAVDARRAFRRGRQRPRLQPGPARQERPGGQGRRLPDRGGRAGRRSEEGDAGARRRRGPRRLPAGNGGRVHDPRPRVTARTRTART